MKVPHKLSEIKLKVTITVSLWNYWKYFVRIKEMQFLWTYGIKISCGSSPPPLPPEDGRSVKPFADYFSNFAAYFKSCAQPWEFHSTYTGGCSFLVRSRCFSLAGLYGDVPSTWIWERPSVSESLGRWHLMHICCKTKLFQEKDNYRDLSFIDTS